MNIDTSLNRLYARRAALSVNTVTEVHVLCQGWPFSVPLRHSILFSFAFIRGLIIYIATI